MRNLAAMVGLVMLARAEAAETGQALFAQKCAACHQIDGQGLPNPIPPLAGSPLLLDDESVVAKLLLRGKAGMPAFGQFLKDDQIAEILTYARGAWGNAAPEITEGTVSEVRKELGDAVQRRLSN